ncbi:MAG TPA: MBL fold metallo-hydrolase [Bryobacteraceae bacterium]|nr:MBL fold metallo-hydrolase [Bryobacteraceae bacterium]
MDEPTKQGAALLAEIDATETATPTLWWLGHAGFAIKYASLTFYVDPCLSFERAPIAGSDIHNADLILCTHKHEHHLDPIALPAILKASPRAKVVIPKSVATHANSLGIGYERMTTTDSDLRIEYFKNGLYGRVYAVPSAHDRLDWTPIGGYPYLGYLIRFGQCTIYHPGDCVLYEGIVDRLRPYNVSVALLPIAGRNFSVSEAAQLAEDIGARWLVPMHYGAFNSGARLTQFIEHMLGHRPAQRFKIFECGEKWTVPGDDEI